ncbi:MAG TPA: sensor histidine kinase, partial [Spirochaetales bacterium]|nr:sensor histidine kinase [Spirochaetales bacterium]
MHYSLGDYVLDIAQNAVESGAGTVRIDFAETEESFSVAVADDGVGMAEEELARALDPFYTDGKKHARRKVGLGLPFLVQA